MFQRLREISDQIIGILDPDAVPNEVVGYPQQRLAGRWNRQVGHACRVARQRFRTPKTDRKLGDGQMI